MALDKCSYSHNGICILPAEKWTSVHRLERRTGAEAHHYAMSSPDIQQVLNNRPDWRHTAKAATHRKVTIGAFYFGSARDGENPDMLYMQFVENREKRLPRVERQGFNNIGPPHGGIENGIIPLTDAQMASVEFYQECGVEIDPDYWTGGRLFYTDGDKKCKALAIVFFLEKPVFRVRDTVEIVCTFGVPLSNLMSVLRSGRVTVPMVRAVYHAVKYLKSQYISNHPLSPIINQLLDSHYPPRDPKAGESYVANVLPPHVRQMYTITASHDNRKLLRQIFRRKHAIERENGGTDRSPWSDSDVCRLLLDVARDISEYSPHGNSPHGNSPHDESS